MSNIKLECSICRTTLPIEEWNKGLSEENQIDIDITIIGWEDWKEDHPHIKIQCSECSGASLVTDMDAF